MRLLSTEYNFQIDLIENVINVLVIESPTILTNVLSDLWKQYNNGDGQFVLLDKDKKIKFSNKIEYISNIFDLNINNKKILNKLYSELNSISNESCLLEKQLLNIKTIEFLDKIINQTPYPLIYNADFNALDIFKLYDVKLDTISTSLLESIVEYLSVINRICNVNIFVFVGLKTLLNEQELFELYKFVSYEKIHLILIEAFQNKLLENEKYLIIDQDACIIEL